MNCQLRSRQSPRHATQVYSLTRSYLFSRTYSLLEKLVKVRHAMVAPVTSARSCFTLDVSDMLTFAIDSSVIACKVLN